MPLQKSDIFIFSQAWRTFHIHLERLSPPGIYIQDSRKIATDDSKKDGNSWESQINVIDVGPDPTVRVAVVPSKVDLAESETSVTGSVAEGTSKDFGPMEFYDKTPSEEMDQVEREPVDAAAWLISALDVDAVKTVSVYQFSGDTSRQ